MFGMNPDIIVAITANIGAVLGVYAQLVQRLTRLETEQKHVSDMMKILLERRLKEREKMHDNYQGNN